MNLAVTLIALALILVSAVFAISREDMPAWVFWPAVGLAGGALFGGIVVLVIELVLRAFNPAGEQHDEI